MGRTLSVSSILSKKYNVWPLTEQWKSAIGEISRPFTWLVFGKPKNGKTSFILQFCRAASDFTKVYYNSMEEGDSKTMQDALLRADMATARPGMFMMGDRDTYAEMKAKLKKNRAQIVVIDSRDYMKLTTDQWKDLTRSYPSKSFILICWEQSGKPLGKYAKDIEFMVSMVTHVKNFRAITNGRFGSGLTYTVWDKGTQSGEQTNLFN